MLQYTQLRSSETGSTKSLTNSLPSMRHYIQWHSRRNLHLSLRQRLPLRVLRLVRIFPNQSNHNLGLLKLRSSSQSSKDLITIQPLDAASAMKQSKSFSLSCFNDSFSNLYVSKCKHVACLACWNLWLETTLECPTCRARTRKNQIFPMNLDDQIEIKSKQYLSSC